MSAKTGIDSLPHRFVVRSARLLDISIEKYVDMISAGQKWCVACCDWHAVSAFHGDSHKWDGRRNRCKESRRVKVKRYRTGPAASNMLGKRASAETKARMSLAHCGEKNHKWRGGITPIYRSARQNALYYDWRRKVFERDDYTCRRCFRRGGGDLHAHHIKAFALFPELRYDVTNGLTLCLDCHKREHGAGAAHV